MSEKKKPSDQPQIADGVEAMYRSHWAVLCARLRKVFGNGPPEPEDLAQSAFIRISKLDDLSKIENPGAFLFRTAHNLGLNAIKAANRNRTFVETELAEVNQSLMQDFSVEDVYTVKERLSVIASAINELSSVQREVVIRCRVYGQTYAEISAATGWSEAKISRQLNAAMRTLQDVRRQADENEGD